MSSILSKIDSPADLKQLNATEMSTLAEEVREVMISVVSQTGGHLASSLGAVELTIALHHVFNAPEDKLVWDVGHQSYTHKILTGRRDRFDTLRQYGGISGFPQKDESPYDTFDTGHAGNSISVALGMAEAERIKGGENKVVAVIGDGSLMTGLALEGMNQSGHLLHDLIVVLNDNEMSISPNVGALSSYLSRLITGRFYMKFREDMKSFLKTIPGVGGSVYNLVKQAEESLKGFFMKGLFFEELGFKYVGPVQGHRLDHLIENLKNIKEIKDHPVLFHVVTTKGKGYPPAEKDPVSFHGIAPFDRKTGKPAAKKDNSPPTYTRIFSETLVKIAQRDKRIVAITAGMSNGTGLNIFKNNFPERFYDVGIAEQHAVTFAAGLASQGLRPVVAIYSTFLQRAYDQIVHDVCLQRLPVTLAIDRAGIVGEDGPTHQGLFDFSYLRHIPNLVLMAPMDENELQHMLKTAIERPLPSAIRYPRGEGRGVKLDKELRCMEIGKGEVIAKGEDVAILAVGVTVYPALSAAEDLEKEGIRVTVVNSRFIKPLDEELILSLAKDIGKIVTVEENVLSGGFGSAVTEFLRRYSGSGNLEIECLGIPGMFIEHGPQELLRNKYGIDKEGIKKAIKNFLGIRN